MYGRGWTPRAQRRNESRSLRDRRCVTRSSRAAGASLAASLLLAATGCGDSGSTAAPAKPSDPAPKAAASRCAEAEPSARRRPRHLHRLLVRRPVLPRQQRLRDRPERAEVERVPARLAAVLPGRLADRVARVELRGGHAGGLPQRRRQRRAAALEAPLAAVHPRVPPAHPPAEQRPQVLLR